MEEENSEIRAHLIRKLRAREPLEAIRDETTDNY